jgi:hypothetical protein
MKTEIEIREALREVTRPLNDQANDFYKGMVHGLAECLTWVLDDGEFGTSPQSLLEFTPQKKD